MTLVLAFYAWRIAANANLRATWEKVIRDPVALSAAIVLAIFALVTLVDSVHFRRALPAAAGTATGTAVSYAPTTESLLDVVLARQIATREIGYSQPLAYKAFEKAPMVVDDRPVRAYSRLAFGGAQLADPDSQWAGDLLSRAAVGLVVGVVVAALAVLLTAFVIGTLATSATLPCAVVFGVLAGYFKGWVDELIQYLYTTRSSVPNVLLIAACVLMVQVYLDQHTAMFETGTERSDVKIFLLCVILGVTGWATLCRLIRGETLKLRELDFVQAATAFGVSHTRIMVRHIVPNVMHLVLITTVLSFSDLILYEAVLTYVGVGVDPSMNSFGGMINLARSELSRDPVVWWSFVSAFVFMVTLVLAANLFADGVRDAFDPRARSFRPRLRRAA